MFDEAGTRSRSHGLRPEILAAQAHRLGLPLCHRPRLLGDLRGRLSPRRSTKRERSAITHVIFGDIMYDANREFPERVCAAAGLTAVEPLWGEPTERLYREFVAHRRRRPHRDRSRRRARRSRGWADVSRSTCSPNSRPPGVDPCGEHGEYHTVVIDAPLFSSPIDLVPLDHVSRDGCWALDLQHRRQPDEHEPCCTRLSSRSATRRAAARAIVLARRRQRDRRARIADRPARPERLRQDHAAKLLSRRAAAAIAASCRSTASRCAGCRGASSRARSPSCRRRRIPPSTTRCSRWC